MPFKFVIDLIEEGINKSTQNALRSAATSGRIKAINIRRKMIIEWFDGNGSHISAPNANIEEDTFSTNGLGGMLKISTWTDDSAIEPYVDAEIWRDNHGGIGVPSNIYVPSLSFEYGILGLPQYANTYESIWGRKYNGRGFVEGENTAFTEKEPLESYIVNNKKWDDLLESLSQGILSKIDF